MDTYVRQLGVDSHHDEFYRNETIMELFKSYTTKIVSRYTNSSAVFGWELANDPRFAVSLAFSYILLTHRTDAPLPYRQVTAPHKL